MSFWIQYDIDSAAGFAAAAIHYSKVLWTTSGCGFAAGDPLEVGDGVAAIDRTTIPNFDPVLDHVIAADFLQLLLLYWRGEGAAADRHVSRITAATSNSAGTNNAEDRI